MYKLVLPFLLILCISCEKNSDKLEFITGFGCGFCGGYDSLSITKSSMSYKLTYPCEQEEYSLNQETSEDDWEALKREFNWKDFEAVDVDVCHICVDGCDTWLIVKEEGRVHNIRWGTTEEEQIENIRPIVDLLGTIKGRLYQDLDMK